MKIVEWHEHPRIEEIDDFVEKHFDKNCRDEYFNYSGIHIVDFKHEIRKYIEDRRELLGDLEALIDELPDDEKEEYEIEVPQ